MSTNDKVTCPGVCEKTDAVTVESGVVHDKDNCEKKEKKIVRKVNFPDDEKLVTQYFEPANPWQDVPSTTRAQLAAEYLEYCRSNRTPPIDSVLQQIRELPENTIGGTTRAPRLVLSDCSLLGSAPTDALEAVLKKVQFRKLELDHTDIDDEGAEALFDMIEYYESTSSLCIFGPRLFGIRGWQAASRMIKRSSELVELEVSGARLEAGHAPVLVRALRPAACALRALALQAAALAGEPLLALVLALKTNTSVRELRLGDNQLSPSDAVQVATLLRYNTRIHLLDLSNNQIQDAGLAHIACALEAQAAHTPPSPSTIPPLYGRASGYESRGLAFLVLWNNQLTRNCAPHLAKILRTSQSLCVLNVGRNALGADGVRALAPERAAPLVSLGLQAARLPHDARSVALLVRAHSSLQRLDLRENKFSITGLEAILSAMKENTTLTQIDLDDPPETNPSSVNAQSCTEAATMARLLSDIRAICRRNESDNAAPDRLLRKISLTCHTAPLPKSAVCEEGGRSRLRSPAPSPAPSPAGSPVPAPAHSRFSVIPVTPDRVTHSPSPNTPTKTGFCSTPSRFKVVQVAEPPQIQIHQAPRKSPSRFSVTRNYDTIYNPTLPPTSPSPSPSPSPSSSPAPELPGDIKFDRFLSSDDEKKEPIVDHEILKTSKHTNDTIRNKNRDEISSSDVNKVCKEEIKPKDNFEIIKSKTEIKPEYNSSKTVDIATENRSLDTQTKGIMTDFNVEVEIDEVDKIIEIKADREMKNDEIKIDNIVSNEKLETEQIINKASDIESLNMPESVIMEPILSDIKLTLGPGAAENIHEIIKIEPETILSSVSVKSDIVTCEASDVKHHSDAIVIKNIDSLENERFLKDSGDFSNSVKQLDIVKISDVRDSQCVKSDKCNVNKNITSHNETIDNIGDDKRLQTDTNVKNSVGMSDNVKTEPSVTVSEDRTKVHLDQNVNKIDNKGIAIKQIAAITQGIDNIIQEMNDLSSISRNNTDLVIVHNIVPALSRDSVVLKKNKSESSLDSPDLEVSRLMRKPVSAFCDSSSSLEISGSSVESLNTEGRIKAARDDCVRTMSTESSVESTSDVTPVNLNISISSNESVSPIIFNTKKIHGSLSSLEASVSSVDSARQEKVMVTSADSGIEYSLQNPSDVREDSSSNEGTLTCSSSLKESVKKDGQETLTSPKRTSSLLDVPALKSKGLDRMRKISWVAPSASFHLPKPEERIEYKLPSNLEKLLSLFQHPSSLFSRNSDDEKKSTSSTPPRKDSSLTSSFWSWGSVTEKNDKDDTDSLSEATDSTLSERVQVSFVDESFSRKLDSKTPSTDTDNTLSEFQTFPTTGDTRVTEITTDDNLVQKCLALSDKCIDASTDQPACDKIDLNEPNDLNNVYENRSGDRPETGACSEATLVKLDDEKTDVRPRSFASVLKSSGSENSMEKQTSPETGQPVDKLPSKVIRGIKENISPENTLTTSITTRAIAMELTDRQGKNKTVVNAVWEVTNPLQEKTEIKSEGARVQSDLAPIATIDETSDVAADDLIQLAYIDDAKDDDRIVEIEKEIDEEKRELCNVDLGKDALSYLMFENQEFETTPAEKSPQGSLAQELRDAEIKEMLDLSPELVIDEAVEIPEIFTVEIKGRRSSPIIPERAKIKKSNSLEDLTKRPVEEEKDSPKLKSIAFKVPESTTPRDIPERKSKLRSRSGSSPKSLPESLNKPCPLIKMDSILSKKKKKVSSLGKIARDSLLALNMSEEEIAEFRRSYKLTSVESLRSLESVSEDANSQSGTSFDSRCKACLRTSQESLMSLDSITEDCRCVENCEKRQNR
ncbi:uncharacterized protein LOC126779878 isoform X2 [Nymphalis io]|uniref:uncharacterized protein LOC126779878 isoform X2 n=1 Tax=Inachis io TaxID=171585 RepID=UPI0021684C91|nr:uncharacterized protein LOC126779878 isoform X2 [Nymphalis io]